MSCNLKDKLKTPLVFVVCMAILTLVTFLNSGAVIKEEGKYEVYLGSNSSNCKVVGVDKNEVKRFSLRYGESCEFSCESFDLVGLLDEYSAKIVYIEKTENGESYYCFSEKIKFSKTLNGKKVNLHVHWTKEKIKIGTPIIFGSY